MNKICLPTRGRGWGLLALAALLFTTMGVIDTASAHGVADADQQFLEGASGLQIIGYMYLGAKHMVTGYDHLLFLVGVIFFLYRLKEIALYVSLFAIGHSVTLLAGVLGGFHVNVFIIDAIIGLSIVYKAFENLNGFETIAGVHPNTKIAVLIFGFFHGLGLASKLQDLQISQDGLIANIVSFNIGVELGQFTALALILVVLNTWRTSEGYLKFAYLTNAMLMGAGFMLMGYQLTGYFLAAENLL